MATNQAGPVALLSGEADVIVSDWPWALRQRAMGEHVKFAPYSSALGAVMVAPNSPIKKLADLKGKKLGVAGGAIDKSWLLLRAYSKKELGTDIAELALPSYGAAPLLTEETRSGRLDAVLNFWTYAARLEGDNYRTVIGMDDVLKALGIEPVPALVGFHLARGDGDEEERRDRSVPFRGHAGECSSRHLRCRVGSHPPSRETGERRRVRGHQGLLPRRHSVARGRAPRQNRQRS